MKFILPTTNKKHSTVYILPRTIGDWKWRKNAVKFRHFVSNIFNWSHTSIYTVQCLDVHDFHPLNYITAQVNTHGFPRVLVILDVFSFNWPLSVTRHAYSNYLYLSNIYWRSFLGLSYEQFSKHYNFLLF